MKRFLFTGMLALGALGPAVAQSGGYEDDIYSNSTPSRPQGSGGNGYQQDDSYSDRSGSGSNSGSYRTDSRSYSADDYDYIDYDDDYAYSTRFRRFNDPFYNVNYWSGFWGPWGYDPFWGPSWGRPAYGWGGGWGRPGFSVTIGYGGPYWSSYWGNNNWYGYNGFASCWGYPYYAGGGWGGGYGYGYQNGYWNGYYDGLYGAGYGANPYYGYRRAVTYGPRSTLNSPYNGFRMADNSVNARPSVPNASYGPRDGMRQTNATRVPVINENGQPASSDRAGGMRSADRRGDWNAGNAPRNEAAPDAIRTDRSPVPQTDRPRRSGWFSDNNSSNAPARVPATQDAATDRPRRGGWFGNGTDAAPADRNAAVENNGQTRPRRGGWFSNDAPNERPAQVEQRSDRGGWFDRGQQPQRQPQMEQRQWGGGNREAVGGGFERPQRTFEQPQQIQRQPSFEQPRMSAPRMESAPSRSAPSGNFGGGGGFRRR